MDKVKRVRQPPQTRITCVVCGPTSGRDGFVSVIAYGRPTVDYCPECWGSFATCPTCDGTGRVQASLHKSAAHTTDNEGKGNG